MPDTKLAEAFKAELEALMAKYPTMRLTVNHQISIDEIRPVTPVDVISSSSNNTAEEK